MSDPISALDGRYERRLTNLNERRYPTGDPRDLTHFNYEVRKETCTLLNLIQAVGESKPGTVSIAVRRTGREDVMELELKVEAGRNAIDHLHEICAEVERQCVEWKREMERAFLSADASLANASVPRSVTRSVPVRTHEPTKASSPIAPL